MQDNDDGWIWWYQHENEEEEDENEDDCSNNTEFPFKPKNLTSELQDKLKSFYQNHNLSDLYKSYNWHIDTWENGFPKILEIESNMHPMAQKNQVTKENIMAIVDWGLLPTRANVRCNSTILKVSVFQNNRLPLHQLLERPQLPLEELSKQTNGLGPTYLSKILRFLAPVEYGAIDTRIVRTFGEATLKQSERWLFPKR